MNPELSQLTGTSAVGCSALLGVMVWTQWVHLSGIGALLCVLVCLLRELRDGWRDLARLYEMKDLEENERNGKTNQPNSQTVQPPGQLDDRIRLSIELRRKALLLRRNADKLDHLLFKPFRLLFSILRQGNKQGGESGLRLGDSLVVKNAKIMDARMNGCQKFTPVLAIKHTNFFGNHVRKLLLIFRRVLKAHIFKRVALTPNVES
jgi:hypothetical protein